MTEQGATTSRATTSRATAVAIGLLLVAGATLRLVQWAAGASLWTDEISIAQDVHARGLVELVSRPLTNFHVAPAGFLTLVDLATTVFGDGERALRLVPFLSSLAVLPLFILVARRFVHGLALVAATAAFSLSPAFVWYAGNLKQYSGDVAATLLLVWLALRLLPPDARRPRLAAAGGFVLLVSQPAVAVAFVLCAILAYGAYRSRDPEHRRTIEGTIVGWGAMALTATAVALSLVTPETTDFMYRYWAGSFPPPPWEGLAELLWLPRRLALDLAHLLVFVAPSEPFQLAVAAVPLGLAAVGVVALWRRDPWTTALLVAPTVAALGAATVRLLPFRGRLTLYATWPLLVLAAAGAAALAGRVRRPAMRRAVAVAATLALAGPAVAVLAVRPPPYRSQEARPVLAEVARRFEPGDVLYVYCGARAAIDYYGPRVGLERWIQGGCHGADLAPYRRELMAVADAPRVWFFYTLAHPVFREPPAIRAVLARGRREADHVPDPYGNVGPNEATAYLYVREPPAEER